MEQLTSRSQEDRLISFAILLRISFIVMMMDAFHHEYKEKGDPTKSIINPNNAAPEAKEASKEFMLCKLFRAFARRMSQ